MNRHQNRSFLSLLKQFCLLFVAACSCFTTESALLAQQTQKVKQLEMQYNSQRVADSDIKRLGQFFLDRGYADDEPYVISIDKTESTDKTEGVDSAWQLSITARDPKAHKNKDVRDSMAQFAFDISENVFGGAKVEFRVSDIDGNFLTAVESAPTIGRSVSAGLTDVYYQESQVEKQAAEKMAVFVAGVNQQNKQALILTNTEQQWTIRLFVNDSYETNHEFYDFCNQLIKDAPSPFGNGELKVELIDNQLVTLASIPGWGGPTEPADATEVTLKSFSINELNVYYDWRSIEKRDVVRLAEQLEKQSPNQSWNLKLGKSGNLWQLSITFNPEFLNDENNIQDIGMMASTISVSVFDGQPCEILAYDGIESEPRIVKADWIMGQTFVELNGARIWFDRPDVKGDDAMDLAKILQESQFSDGTPKDLRLERDANVWKVSVIVEEQLVEQAEVQEAFRNLAKLYADELDTDCFEFSLCDGKMKQRCLISSVVDF